MSKSFHSFNKKEREKKKAKKREDKKKRKEERKNNPEAAEKDDMIAYLDADGNIIDSPLEEKVENNIEDIEISVPKKSAESRKKKGRLVQYNEERGYGFIESLDGAEKVFVHMSEFIDEIQVRNMVSYETEKSDRGLRAIKVEKL